MTDFLLSIDPGKSSGVTLWLVPDDTHATMLAAWQFSGGLSGLLDWHRDHTYEYIEGCEVFVPQGDGGIDLDRDSFKIGTPSTRWTERTNVVVEKFTPLQNKGFSLTLDSVEPLRIEGALVALGIVPDYEPSSPHWQRPNEMFWVPGKNAAEKRKRQVAWVKERFPELHLTGKDVSAPDADDARSAQWHALAYLRRNHLPSARYYFPEVAE
jgi:hypothetical protein